MTLIDRRKNNYSHNSRDFPPWMHYGLMTLAVVLLVGVVTEFIYPGVVRVVYWVSSIAAIFYTTFLYKALQYAYKLNSTDFLTGLCNRSHFFFRLSQYLKDAAKADSSIYLVAIDVNKFKYVNDVYGHLVGDKFLASFSKKLKDSVRTNDLVCRLGGDEFVIVLPTNIPKEAVVSMLSRMHTNISGVVTIDGHQIEMGFSAGISQSIPGDTESDIIHRADLAMYHAKRERLGIYFYDPATCADRLNQAKLLKDLREALKDQKITVVYQPKMNLSTKEVYGCEVLARWNHPVHGSISPDTFIVLAEQEGLINQLLHQVMLTVFTDLQKLNEINPNFNVAINVSADNLLNMNVVGDIINMSNTLKVNLNRLTLEVTETALMKNPDEAIKYLVMLHALGIKLSLDDFGTGNSSFIYLKYLPIQEIKIDRTFIRDMHRSHHDMMIVQSTINLAKTCNIQVVAEGVEEEQQLQAITDMGCDYMQGYLLSKPLQIDELVEFIKENKHDNNG